MTGSGATLQIKDPAGSTAASEVAGCGAPAAIPTVSGVLTEAASQPVFLMNIEFFLVGNRSSRGKTTNLVLIAGLNPV